MRIREYFETYKPDVVLFLETPFSHQIYIYAEEYGAKTVAIPMHETLSAKRLNADLMICCCRSAWDKARPDRKKYLFLPIGLEMFPFKERTGHTFVTNIGYGGINDRRQTAVITEAFSQIKDPDARLIMNAQHEWPKGCVIDDKRITFNLKNYDLPTDIYREGDISILPIAYGGYERSILESMASGMPTLTTNADPMNMYQHDKRFLVNPAQRYKFSDQWVTKTIYNKVSVQSLREKMEWLLTIDTAKYSRRARRQAEAQSWESEEIDYKKVWLGTLERLCNEN